MVGEEDNYLTIKKEIKDALDIIARGNHDAVKILTAGSAPFAFLVGYCYKVNPYPPFIALEYKGFPEIISLHLNEEYHIK